jgi:hypothetical protein
MTQPSRYDPTPEDIADISARLASKDSFPARLGVVAGAMEYALDQVARDPSSDFTARSVARARGYARELWRQEDT